MRISILSSSSIYIYKLRREVIEKLIEEKHEVFICCFQDNYDTKVSYVDKLFELGCNIKIMEMNNRNMNPIKDLLLLLNYIRYNKANKPDIVLGFTIKPNIYGGIACRIMNIPYIANITGLGTAIENGKVIKKIISMLYKIALKNAKCIFFQNKFNRNYFIKNKIISNNHTKVIAGSGINLDEFKLQDYQNNNNMIKFLFIGRIMKNKGIEELLEGAKIIKQEYHNVEFTIIGEIVEQYENLLMRYENANIIRYIGRCEDVKPYIKNSHAIIHPSYHEGMSNVLLEACALGRPVLASKVAGCLETFDEGVSGYGFNPKSVKSMVDVIIRFIHLPFDKRKQMGINARRKMEREFDRKNIVNTYIGEIAKN